MARQENFWDGPFPSGASLSKDQATKLISTIESVSSAGRVCLRSLLWDDLESWWTEWLNQPMANNSSIRVPTFSQSKSLLKSSIFLFKDLTFISVVRFQSGVSYCDHELQTYSCERYEVASTILDLISIAVIECAFLHNFIAIAS